jgi:hypothetical protein
LLPPSVAGWTDWIRRNIPAELRPTAARLADAAAVRAFLDGVEPTLAHQQAFHAACRVLVERLERDLEAGEVDPDWEDLLRRLLRVYLPLVDPAWPEAHRLPEDLEEAKWRWVESVGGPISAQ